MDLQYEVFKFNYIIIDENFLFVNLKESNPFFKTGKVYIKIPTWLDMHDIRRKSLDVNPFNRKERKLNVSKFCINKIKQLCIRLEDEDGEVTTDFSKENYLDQINPDLGDFIVSKIDKLISKNVDFGLSSEESKQLKDDLFNYYRAVYRQMKGDSKIAVPDPPSVVLIHSICKMFHCLPEEAIKIPKRDIDMHFLMREMETHCQNPHNIGMSPRVSGKYDRVYSGHNMPPPPKK